MKKHNNMPSKNTKPSDWQETTLGEVAEIAMGQSPKGESYNEVGDGVPFYQGITEFGDRFVKIKKYTTQPTKIVDVNTILFSVRAPVGVVNFTKHKCCIGRGNAGFVMKNGNQDFLFYYLRYLKYYIQNYTSGTVFSSISGKELKNLNIYIPANEHEQRTIAAVLSSLDDKIELLRQENETLEQIGQNLFKEWFGKYSVDKPEELPEGWRVGKIENLVDILSGFAFSSVDFNSDGQYKLVTIKNVQNKSFDPETKDRLLEIPKKMSYYCFLKTGDILLSLTGNVGRICLVYGNDFLLNQRVAKLKPKNKSDYAFSYFLFLQESTFSILQNIASGTAQQNLSPIQTKNIEIVLPSRQLLDQFGLIGNIIVDKINYNNVQIQVLAKNRDMLLPKLMSGEVKAKIN